MNGYVQLSCLSALLGTLTAAAGGGVAGTSSSEGAANAANTARSSESFDITLTRPAEVGQRLHVRGTAEQERTITALYGEEERQLESTNMSVSFDAVAEVLAVDRQGMPTEVSYTVFKCFVDTNGESTEVAPRSAVIFAKRSADGTVFKMNGRPMSTFATQALQMIAGLDNTGTTNDQVLGSAQPRSIGETWAIDTNQVAENFQQQWQVPVRRSDIYGETSFVDIKEHAGENCLVIQSQISAQNVLPGMGVLPENFEVQTAIMTADYEGLFPEDEQLPSLADTIRMNMEAIVVGSLGEQQLPVEMRINGTRTAHRTATVLVPNPNTFVVVPDADH